MALSNAASGAPRRLRQLADIPVSQLRHVGEKRSEALASIGIESVFDLLTTYPRRYIDRTKQIDVSDLSVGDEAAVYAEVQRVNARRTRQGKALVDVVVSDDGGTMNIIFFNQAWRAKQLVPGVQALFFGKVGDYRGQRQMTNPVVDVIVGASGVERDASRVGRVVAIYPASGKAGLTSWEMGGFVEEALQRAGEFLDPVPASLRDELRMVDRTKALAGVHVPDDIGSIAPARRRLAFDEFLRLQVLLRLRRGHLERSAVGIRHSVTLSDLDAAPGSLSTPESSLVRRFLSDHHYVLTGAQRRVLDEIFRDLSSPLPMHRLLQGDVGSGKTTVALASFLAVIEGGRQGAMMAPTEVLAEQHVASLRRDVASLQRSDEAVLGGTRPLNIQLLTGRLKATERRAVLQGLASGSVDIVVGTHALLTDDVRFRALGLVVIDEQHRFGVEQRATLRDKGREHSGESLDPDLLVMTATPIPRTAAMVLFGDLDISILNELPEGRRPIETSWAKGKTEVADAWKRVRSEVEKGKRVFVICPLVEGSDRVVATSAVEEHERLAKTELKGLRIGLLHGQMKSHEKDWVMEQFRHGVIDVLVATVVVEVGVDVPEATVMVIEDAWRFGLAQLHQLRGRVGRGGEQSYCFLLGEAPNEESAARLEALVASNDGFALAEVDLDLRGEGTLLGARQRGRSDLKLASLRDDQDLLFMAHDAATKLVGPSDDLSEHPDLVDELRLFIDDEEADYLFKS